jgi:DNA repair protein RadC
MGPESDPPFFGLLRSERIRPGTVRDEPDWALVQRITGKQCPEGIDLRNLSKMTEAELGRLLELSPREAKKLSSALALGERLASEPVMRDEQIKNAPDVYRIFRGMSRESDRETFYAMTLDRRHRLIDLHRVSEGTLATFPVHPRECFLPALRDQAWMVIFIHNHPSGDPEPSKDDFLVTAKLVEAGELLGIGVLDHVVVGAESFVSLRERGAFGRNARDRDPAKSLAPQPVRDEPETDDRTLRTVALLSAELRAHPKYRDFRTLFGEGPGGLADPALLAVDMAKAVNRWENARAQIGDTDFLGRLADLVIESCMDGGSVPRDLGGLVEKASDREFGDDRPEMG